MDQNHYINSYIDTTIGVLHEYLTQILQLKTQLKLAQEVIAEKERINVEQDAAIGEQNKIIEEAYQKLDEQIASGSNELNNARAENQRLINEMDALRRETEAVNQKASHMESCLKTVVDLKKQLQNRDTIIGELEANVKDLQSKLENKEIPVSTKKPKTTVATKKKVAESEDDF
mgnify:FL=1